MAFFCVHKCVCVYVLVSVRSLQTEGVVDSQYSCQVTSHLTTSMLCYIIEVRPWHPECVSVSVCVGGVGGGLWTFLEVCH